MSIDVYISSDASLDLWTYVRAVDTEIGGWGYAFFQEDGALVWDTTFLVPQIATKGEVDFETTDGDAVAIERAAKDGVLDKEGFVWVSWHSHHTLGAFWSNTDDKRIAALAKTGISHLLSFVGCHDGKYRLRYDAFNVKHGGVTIPHVKIDELPLVHDMCDERFDMIYTAIKENLKERPKVKAVTQPVSQQSPPKGLPMTTETHYTSVRPSNDPFVSVEEALEAKDLIEQYGMSEAHAVEMVTYGRVTIVDGHPEWVEDDEATYDARYGEWAEAFVGGGAQ